MLVYAKYEGSDHPIAAARNETVAKVKAMIAARCSSLAAKLFALRHGAVELKDSAALGDYHLSNGAMLEVCVATSQPYGGYDYSKAASQLENDGAKKPASAYYDPDEYRGEWTKGDEYLSYPPVDVHNKWSSVAPSSSTDLTLSPKARKERANGQRASSVLPQRILTQKYICRVRDCESTALFKMEGKWSGWCDISGGEKFEARQYACHSLLTFSSGTLQWTEDQNITSSEGLSNGTKYRYTPVSDGLFHVSSDSADFSNCVVRLREDASGVMIISANSTQNGCARMVETITCNEDFSQRVRVRQKFSTSGSLLMMYVFTEKKFVDSESGALEPLNL